MAHVTLALIGCGAIARRHAGWIRSDGRARLAAVYDPQHDSASALRHELAPDALVHANLDEVWNHPGLDGVIVCSPTTRHYQHVCQAIDRRLHVLCEKPLAIAREEIVDLIARARQANRILSIAHQRRYMSPYSTARRELVERADDYGPIQQIHIFGCERWQQTITGTWRDDPSVPAGYFGDAGLHHIDVAHFISGQTATSVVAQSHRRGSHVEIATGVLAELSGGAQLTAHFVGHAHHWRDDLHFHCRDADLLVRSKAFLVSDVFRCRNNQVELVADLVPDSNPVTAFVTAIETGQPTVSPAEIALPVYDWIDACLRSLASGRRESVGPATPGTA